MAINCEIKIHLGKVVGKHYKLICDNCGSQAELLYEADDSGDVCACCLLKIVRKITIEDYLNA